MLDRIEHWATALDSAGLVSLPVWVVVAGAAFVLLLCVLTLLRAGPEGRSASMLALLLIIVLAGWWWGRDYVVARDRAAEQRALDTRAFELAARAFAPGSALGCLDAIAGEALAGACEKALFATPEATAAARRINAAPSAGCEIPVGSRAIWRSGRSMRASKLIRRAGRRPALAGWRALYLRHSPERRRKCRTTSTSLRHPRSRR